MVDHPQKHTSGDCVRNKIKISDFSRHFKGSFKGHHYCSDFPPSKQFSNHASCKAFSDFVSKEILKRVTVDDVPFSLDKLADVSRYVYRGSYRTKCDDKSGYDHVSLSPSSQTYVGFQWSGFWFVCTTLPFRWKISPYIYHTIGLVASGYLRAHDIPCS